MALAFESHGSGPPLVLLHGIGSRRGVWDPVVGALARERRVIAVDLPGFAESPPEDFEPTAAGFTARLERWFAEQGLGRPHVAGNSMGGAIALELARRGAVASATARLPRRLLERARAGLRAALAARLARASSGGCGPRCPRSRARPPGASRSSRRSTGGRGDCRPPMRWRRSTRSSTAPAFERGAGGLRPLPVRRGRRAARRAGHGRVGHARRAADPAPGGARAATAAVGAPRDAAGLRPRALPRRPGDGRGGAAGRKRAKRLGGGGGGGGGALGGAHAARASAPRR